MHWFPSPVGRSVRVRPLVEPSARELLKKADDAVPDDAMRKSRLMALECLNVVSFRDKAW
jgi:hypothetical protein